MGTQDISLSAIKNRPQKISENLPVTKYYVNKDLVTISGILSMLSKPWVIQNKEKILKKCRLSIACSNARKHVMSKSVENLTRMGCKTTKNLP